ncbi:hypothetical protein ACTFIW_000864 [Dictyostelium discoideum]
MAYATIAENTNEKLDIVLKPAFADHLQRYSPLEEVPKSSAFAATVAAQDAAKVAIVEVNLRGPGREPAVRGLMSSGLTVTAIRDATPVPHNGCRKRRRV